MPAPGSPHLETRCRHPPRLSLIVAPRAAVRFRVAAPARIPVGRDLGIGQNQKFVPCTARLIPGKGVVEFIDAMACGKPVANTHHKGCEDAVVDQETGFLVPVKRVQPLVDRTVQLLDDETLRARLGQAGRRRVEEHFEFEACTRQIVVLF